MIPELIVDLSRQPADRWQLSNEQIEQAQRLLNTYLQDLGGLDDYAELLAVYAGSFVEPAYMAEIQSIADQIGATFEEALLVNLYYDAIKFIFGCTAFAVDTPDGPLHARNLDWWTENDALSRYTITTRFIGAERGEFVTVGWPGFVGAMSGIAPGRFAVTLNAVLSNDPPTLAKPISLFLRTVFEQAPAYEDAIRMLAEETIASDCLLLITGPQPGQMAVMERTPTRSAIRYGQDGFIAVTNDYQMLDAGETTSDDVLQSTSCGRFDRAVWHLRENPPMAAKDCLAVLRDPEIRMKITVQHMVFSAQTGLYEVVLPERQE